MDFARLWGLFEQYQVAFVSVTQQLNTTTSTGRLMLNVLMSFAQFEREIISERTSDKMCAARRKGKWMGGPPILGYNLDRERHCILVNPDEVPMVREIFNLYIQDQSALKVAEELNRRGWMTKSWIRKNGKRVEGTRWDKARVVRHLTNVAYIGKVLHKGELYEGEHEGIIEEHIFDQAQSILEMNGNGCGPVARNSHGALLKGLIRCGACGAAMAHTYTNKRGKLYRYYACNTRQKQGTEACESGSLPAQDVEDFVVAQIRQIGKDPQLVEAVHREALKLQQDQVPRLESELAKLKTDRQKKTKEIDRLVDVLSSSGTPLPTVRRRLKSAEETLARLDERMIELRRSIVACRAQTVDADHLRKTLEQFDPLWEVLRTAERIALVRQVVTSAVYEPATGNIALTLRYSQGHQNQD
jgi:site-specific DNA recombinase